jgi:hypothetical protein
VPRLRREVEMLANIINIYYKISLTRKRKQEGEREAERLNLIMDIFLIKIGLLCIQYKSGNMCLEFE